MGCEPQPLNVSENQTPSYRHRRTAAEVLRCKKAHRTEISPAEWDKFGYARKEEVLSRPLEIDGVQTLPITRIRRRDVTVPQFYEHFVQPRWPCIIEGAMDEWPAMRKWDPQVLASSLRHASLKVGEDDKGRKLRMKASYFHDYMEHQQDDSPLYLFETRIESEPSAQQVLHDFQVPDIFPHDFLDLVNSSRKPPYRWWSIGPRRSGTAVHTDPLGTGAWNAVTHGRKRWVLFEPSTPSRVAKGKDVIDKKTEDDEAIMYFDFLLPRIKKKHPCVRVYEGTQGPGEIIFVPSEWHHGVLNLEDTVAVTQNYCGYDNFELVWMRTRRERKKLAHLWLRNMRKFAPDLHRRALELNARDRYKMRHERGPSDESSESDSSSESSSDSTSDDEADLDFSLLGAVPGISPPWKSASAQLPPPAPPPPAGASAPLPPPAPLPPAVAPSPPSELPSFLEVPETAVSAGEGESRECREAMAGYPLPRKRPHAFASQTCT